MTNPSLAAVSKKFRESNDLSQREFAKKIGVSLPTYTLFERGDRVLSLHLIQKIAKTIELGPKRLGELLLAEPTRARGVKGKKRTTRKYTRRAHRVSEDSTDSGPDLEATTASEPDHGFDPAEETTEETETGLFATETAEETAEASNQEIDHSEQTPEEKASRLDEMNRIAEGR